MHRPRRFALCNPGARGAVRCADLAAHPALDGCRETANPGDVPRVVREAVEAGAEVIVAVGGDATVAGVASALLALDPRPSLAIAPAGTGNDLARTLGLPLDVGEALDALDAWVLHALDVIEAEADDGAARLGLNAAVGGPPAAASEGLDPETKRRWGPLAFAGATAAALGDLHRVRAHVTWPDGEEELDVLGVAVCNGRTAGGGVVLAPMAEPDDGLLDVLLVPAGGALDYAGALAALVAGDPTASALVRHRRVSWVRLEAREPFPFNLDGDLLTEGAVTFRLLPAALRVWAPPRG